MSGARYAESRLGAFGGSAGADQRLLAGQGTHCHRRGVGDVHFGGRIGYSSVKYSLSLNSPPSHAVCSDA